MASSQGAVDTSLQNAGPASEPALAASNEEYFRLVSEAIPQQVWTARADGSLDYVNQRVLEYFDATLEQILGWGWQHMVHPDDLPAAVERWVASLSDGQAYETEFRLRHAHDGVYRWHLARALPLRDSGGVIVKWFGTNTDIHEKKAAEGALRVANEQLEQRVRDRTAQLQESNEQLQRSNRELQEFAYVASHDLQEPLRKIQAFGDRLSTKFGPSFPPDAQDFLARMQHAAARMSTLIDDLLTFARVTSRTEPFAAIDLAVVVREVLVDLEDRVQRSGAAIDIDALPTIRADPVQMRQMFQNLIGNALKFHKPQTPPRIRIYSEIDPGAASAAENGASPGRSMARIFVHDNGIGFDEKYNERIFGVFQRLHGRQQFEGTGIGLAVCRRIAERHRGTITAISALGEGATFIVALPMG